MRLIFDVDAQTLRRTDKNNPATDSVDYLTAKFNFLSAEWNGIEKVALFKAGDVLKEAKINSSGECIVPWEVLVKDTSMVGRVYGDNNYLYVSVVGFNGTVQIPTVSVKVVLGESGYGEGTESEDPTPDLYAQYVAEVKGYADSVEATAEEIKVIESGIKDSYANAFKGEASGEVVRVDDVSPVEHNARVKVNGKNILPCGTLTFTKNQNVKLDNPIPAGTYTLSAYITSNDTDGESSSVSINSDSEVLKYITLKRNSRVSSTFTVNKPISNIDFCAGYNYSQGVDDTATWADIQIEKGDVATEYTPYIDPTTVTVTVTTDGVTGATYTPNADGSVDITSLSPTMTLLTDTDGVTIDLEYNRDTTAVIGDIESAVNTLNAIADSLIGGVSE